LSDLSKKRAATSPLSGLIHFGAGWCLCFAFDLIALLWASHIGYNFPPTAWNYFGGFLVFMAVKILYRLTAHRLNSAANLANLAEAVFLGGESILLLRNAGMVLCILSYLCCSWDWPMMDERFDLLDKAMGFNWQEWFQWCWREPAHTLLATAYRSLLFQLIFSTIWFASLLDKKRLYETFWILFVALLSTVVISGLMPALGPASALGLLSSYDTKFIRNLADVMAIRAAGGMPVTITLLGGFVAFPSFHTAAALIYMYAFRNNGWLSTAALLLNLLMLISIPAFGDHYLIDMFGGFAIAAFSILAVRFFTKSRFFANCHRHSASAANGV
jgi:membrane-associated phospholipid phosphatase